MVGGWRPLYNVVRGIESLLLIVVVIPAYNETFI
jgi:hypothetical protein